jgi:zinc transport system substrate-binding protein
MRSRTWQIAALVCGLVAAGTAGPAAAQTKVVVSIKPLHSLVAGVMAGVGSPELLVKGASSPHTYAMKPSDAKALNDADLFFRMSESIEPFTIRVARALPKQVTIVTLQDAPGMKLLPRRTGNTFEPHVQDASKSALDRHEHDDHDHDGKANAPDGHAWLDPDNAKAMVARIEQALSSTYPAYAAAFQANARKLTADLDALDGKLQTKLKPVAGKPYIVFHDAFQYLEARFDLNPVGSISISPDVPPSAKRLTDLRKKVVSLNAVCVFAEPQYDTRLVQNLVEGTSARTATLDAEALGLEPGPDLYFAMMRRLADDLKGCLAPQA